MAKNTSRYNLYPVPVTLQKALEVHGALSQQSAGRAGNELLRRAPALLDSEPSIERIGYYLAHSEIQIPVIEPHNIAIDKELAAQLKSVSATWARIVTRSIREGHVLQALLWDQLNPSAPRSLAQPIRSSQAEISITMIIPEALNTELLAVALQRGSSLTQLVDEWLTMMLNVLDVKRLQGQALIQEISADYPAITSTSEQETTMRVSRVLDNRLRATELALAQEGHSWSKATIVTNLLQRALATQLPVMPFAAKDRGVVIEGETYVRVQAQMIRQRRATGTAVSMREMINRYVKRGVGEDEAEAQKVE